MFRNIGLLFGEIIQIQLLWMGVDHIHLYIDSNPDYSVDEIVKKTIESLEKSLLEKFPEFNNGNDYVWERNYFAETIG